MNPICLEHRNFFSIFSSSVYKGVLDYQLSETKVLINCNLYTQLYNTFLKIKKYGFLWFSLKQLDSGFTLKTFS